MGLAGVGAGKGDKSRVSNTKAYRANYSEIDWQHKNPANLYIIHVDCDKCGDSVNLRDAVTTAKYLVLCSECFREL